MEKITSSFVLRENHALHTYVGIKKVEISDRQILDLPQFSVRQSAEAIAHNRHPLETRQTKKPRKQNRNARDKS